MEKLIKGLRHFQDFVEWERHELFERSINGQRPQALLITCSDSRVLPEALLQVDPGDLFVARNAGNLVPPPEVSGGEAATIEYAVSELGVTDIVICGHYRCGAIKALLDANSATSSRTHVANWLSHAEEVRRILDDEFPHLEEQARWDRGVEQNVLVQIRNLTKHPVVAAGLEAEILRIHAWVLRFESSEIFAFDESTSEFHPLGEKISIAANSLSSSSKENPPAEVSNSPSTTAPPTSVFQKIYKDIGASLVVFAVALPLCVAIAKASGAPSAAGILTAVLGGIVVGLIGGGPLQVSGPTAGLIAIQLGINEEIGMTGAGAIVLMAGLIQLTAGFLRIGQWFRAVSPAVVLGMLAGIGAVLFCQQMHITVDDTPSRSAISNLIGIPRAIIDIFDGHPGHPSHQPAALIGLLTLTVLVMWTRLKVPLLHSFPAVLAAIVIATIVAGLSGLSIQRVEFQSITDGINTLDFTQLPALLATANFWQLSIAVAFVATAETLLTSAATDKMHSGPRTKYDRELKAQGIGNSLCGLLGILPMASVIVRSTANVQAGAATKLSTILHGIWMLLFALLLPPILRLIPTAALAATLVLTGIKLIQVRAISSLFKDSKREGVICIVVGCAVFSVDLLSAVLIGVVLSIINLVYTFSRLRIRQRDIASGKTVLILDGCATFLRLPKIAAVLDRLPAGTHLQVDLKKLSYIDHACFTLFLDWEKQQRPLGGSLALDWETLKARFKQSTPRPRQDGIRQS